MDHGKTFAGWRLCMNNDPRNNAAKTRGRPFAKGNPGRPNCSRHRATVLAERLFDGGAEALSRKAIELALAGDTVALRLCIERILPPRRERVVAFSLPPVRSAADIGVAMAAVVEAAATGTILPGEAAEFGKILETYMRALEVTQFEQRLRLLEAQK